ncbi:hypothetical protein REPUB_Repub16aG0072200 [Reevesia pubescens]
MKVGKALGALVVDHPEWKSGISRSYLRIRVAVEHSKPLVAGFWVSRNCSKVIENATFDLELTKFGPWMRVGSQPIDVQTKSKLAGAEDIEVNRILIKEGVVVLAVHDRSNDGRVNTNWDQDQDQVVIKMGGNYNCSFVDVEWTIKELSFKIIDDLNTDKENSGVCKEKFLDAKSDSFNCNTSPSLYASINSEQDCAMGNNDSHGKALYDLPSNVVSPISLVVNHEDLSM